MIVIKPEKAKYIASMQKVIPGIRKMMGWSWPAPTYISTGPAKKNGRLDSNLLNPLLSTCLSVDGCFILTNSKMVYCCTHTTVRFQ